MSDGQYADSSDEEAAQNAAISGNHSVNNSFKPLFDPPNPSSSSTLPSALDAFSEIAGPPQFLNNCVEEPALATNDGDGQPWKNGRRRNRKEKKDLPAGAVMEAKAQLVGIHERVRSDAEGNLPQTSPIQPKGSSSTTGGAAKRVATATNPKAEDAAELLRMCLQCGIPKTFSNARGIVCPQCGDRPPAETDQDSAKKNKGSTVKDKEKSKRMKGQSSHATWKSETEMQLRQQFD